MSTILYTIAVAYFFCVPVRRLREERASLLLRKALLCQHAGNLTLVCLIDLLLDASMDAARMRGLVLPEVGREVWR